jgi:hypothetical protein
MQTLTFPIFTKPNLLTTPEMGFEPNIGERFRSQIMKRFFTLCSLSAALMLSGKMVFADLPQGDHLTVHQWVQLSQKGVVEGRVFSSIPNGEAVGVDGVEIALESQGGDPITSKSDEQGQFVIEDVKPGIYTLTAKGENVYACCAMHVVEAGEESADFPKEAMISLADIDYSVIENAVARYMPEEFDPIVSNIESKNLKKLVSKVSGEPMFKVMQTKGGMDGEILRAGAENDGLEGAELTNVFLFRRNTEVARQVTDEDGRFRMEELKPGKYSLVAIGPKGMGTVGFELVAEGTNQAVSATGLDGSHLIQVACDTCSGSFSMQVAPPSSCSTCGTSASAAPSGLFGGEGLFSGVSSGGGGGLLGGGGGLLGGGGAAGGFAGGAGGLGIGGLGLIGAAVAIPLALTGDSVILIRRVSQSR